jgi:hypothetical protein
MNMYYSYYSTTCARAVKRTHRHQAELEATIFLTILYLGGIHEFLSTMHFSLSAAPTVCWCRHHYTTTPLHYHTTTPPHHYTTKPRSQSFIQTFSTSTVNSLIMASVACNMLRCIWDCWVVPEAVWMVPSNFMINSCMWYKWNINNHYFRSHDFHSGASCSVQVCCATLGCSGLLCDTELQPAVSQSTVQIPENPTSNSIYLTFYGN